MPTSQTDSYLAAPELYIIDLHFSVGDEELKKTLKDVEPIDVTIHRQHGNSPLNGVVRFSSIECAEKAYAIYNNIKLEAYKTYLRLQMTDPTNHLSNEPQSSAYILQVRQWPSTCTNLALFNLFRPFGPLFSARMQYQDQKYKGYALVQFFRQEDADQATHTLHCHQVEGKTIVVSQYLNKPNKPTTRTNLANLTMPSIGSFSPPANNYNIQVPSSPGPEGPIVDPCNLFIKNLDANISSSDLFNHFRRFGRIISARVMRDQETGNSKGFGFVSYTTPDEADKAKTSMHGKTLGSKQIVVRLHEPKKLREAKLANQFSSSSPTSPSESRAPSRRNSDLFIINTVNEFGREDLAGLAPKARREVLMSELQKRFKHIPSVPLEEVNPIIDHLLTLKTDDVLHILKDPTSLQQKITEARHYLQQEKKRRGSEETLVAPIQSVTNNNSFQQQVPQREKFLKAIIKLCPRNAEEILELIMTLGPKERTSCYFNPEYLTKKILEANQALAAIHEEDTVPKVLVPTDVIPTTTSSPESDRPQQPAVIRPATAAETPSGVHSAAYDEIEQFIESLKNKPIHEQKQKLGNRLFPLVKSLGLKSATASKVTINLLDTDDLRELAHSMNEPEKFKQKVLTAEKIVSAK